MKSKPRLKLEPVAVPQIVAPEIMESAKRSMVDAGVRPLLKCVVCSGEATPGAEQLCWVCRRLKISAWREVDQQAQVQE